MLVLFETPGGFALFKVLDEGKLSNVEVIIIFTFFLFLSNLGLCVDNLFFYSKYVYLVFAGFG